jgi:hypothetical protein
MWLSRLRRVAARAPSLLRWFASHYGERREFRRDLHGAGFAANAIGIDL